MPEDERLKTAISAVKEVCSIVAIIAKAVEEDLKNKKKDKKKGKEQSPSIISGLREALKSLLSRAREAPQILATWGAPGLLTFYSAKAADQAEMDLHLLEAVIVSAFCHGDLKSLLIRERKSGRGRGEREEEVKVEISDTAFGYALYLVSLAKYLEDRHQLDLRRLLCGNEQASQLGENVVIKFFDALLNSAARGELRHSEVEYAVETLARLYTINLRPLISKLEEPSRDRDSGKVLEEIVSFCAAPSG
jgi:hypothetical protein